MEAFTVLQSRVAPLNKINVDTDQIIPKQFLKLLGKTGFGQYLFNDWRYLADGKLNPEFPLNNPLYKGAKILVAGDNFGCGSSREHAAWALLDYGFKAVISSSFADIFFNNCYKNGVLPIVVERAVLDKIFQHAEQSYEMTIDLPSQTLRAEGIGSLRFDIDPLRKEFIVKGLDDIASTLSHVKEIGQFEQAQKGHNPWLWTR